MERANPSLESMFNAPLSSRLVLSCHCLLCSDDGPIFLPLTDEVVKELCISDEI
jgi:hypothetical protein